MDSSERHSLIDSLDITHLQETRVRMHLEVLEMLEATSSFDLDIASDVTPAILYGHQQGGVEAAVLFFKLHDATQTHKRFSVLSRVDVGLEPGCYGFGAPDKYRVNSATVRVFENLPDEAIHYSRDDDGKAQITIEHPSAVFKYTGAFTDAATSIEDNTLLANQEQVSFAHIRSELPEHLLVPRFSFGDTVEDTPIDIHDSRIVGFNPLRTMASDIRVWMSEQPVNN